MINPKLKLGWWVIDSARHLQQFYDDLEAGLRPKLVIEAPPQHGKSDTITDFILWLMGKNPDSRNIYTSFSERLGIRANLKIQRIASRSIYKRIFPGTIIPTKNNVTVSGQKIRNREMIEIENHDGYFRNTTVGGSITGESLDLGIIDDPLKGRKESNSITVRNAVWDWFTDDFFTRFSEDAGMLIILTRWHIDDPVGRLQEQDSSVKVVKYRAIATEDEEHRNEGEPLFPEHKSLEFLLERKNVMSPDNWEALYQQNPVISGGNLMKIDWFKWYDVYPVIVRSRIYVDTAQKKGERNDFTVAQKWGSDSNGNIYLLDMIRVREDAPEAQRLIESFYHKHKHTDNFESMKIEDKSSGSTMIQIFQSRGMIVHAIQRSIDKVQRANMWSGYIEMGKVWLGASVPHVSDLTSEVMSFPDGVHDDTIDPMLDAIEDLISNSVTPWW